MKYNDFDEIFNDCCALLEMVRNQTSYIHDVLGMISVSEYDQDTNEIVSLSPFSHENLATLIDNTSQLSSKSDRLATKVQTLIKLTKQR